MHFPDVDPTRITDLPALVAWSGLADPAWTAVNTTLGTVPTLRVLAYLPAAALLAATAAARVTIPATGSVEDDDYTPESTRELTPVEATQVGLLWQAAQQLASRPVTDPFGPTSPPPHGVGSLPEVPSTEEGTAKGDTKRKIKCCQVLDQTDEAEIPELKQKEIDSYYNRLREVKGGPVRPESEPSPEQISALKVRVLELDLAPYADFGIFVNFQHRFSKALKFLNHVLQPDGTFRAVEVPGPPSYEQWLSSWKVFENTLLMFQTEVAPGVHQPIVTPSALEEYKDAFRDMVVNYPEAWHLLVKAEDRCRGEHFPRLRRNLTNRFNKGLAPEFCPTMPWDGVFREAARDRDYWDRTVREPAILFRTAKGGKKEQVGGTGTTTDIAVDKESPKKQRNRSQKERLKKQLAKEREKNSRGHSSSPPRKGDRGPKRDSKGRFLTDRSGKPICFAFNNCECKGVCAKNMVTRQKSPRSPGHTAGGKTEVCRIVCRFRRSHLSHLQNL